MSTEGKSIRLDTRQRPAVSELVNGKKLFDFTLIQNEKTSPVYKIREITYAPQGNQPIIYIHGRMNKKNPEVGDFVIIEKDLPRSIFPTNLICCVITNIRKGVLEALWLRHTQLLIQTHHMSFDLHSSELPDVQMQFKTAFENMIEVNPTIIGEQDGHRIFDMRGPCELNNAWTSDAVKRDDGTVAITYHCADASLPLPVSGDIIVVPPKLTADEEYDSYLGLDGTAFIVYSYEDKDENNGLIYTGVKLDYPLIHSTKLADWGEIISTAGRLSGNDQLIDLGYAYMQKKEDSNSLQEDTEA